MAEEVEKLNHLFERSIVVAYKNGSSQLEITAKQFWEL